MTASQPRRPLPRIGARRPVRQAPRGGGLADLLVGRRGRPTRRLRGGAAALLLVLGVLGGRLVQLQGLDSSSYATRAQEQRLRTVELPATRGAVLDRDGRVLAQDAETRLVYGDPTQVGDPDATAAALAPLLGLPQDQLAARLRTPRTEYVVLARQLDVPTGRQVQALRLPGVGVVPDSRRDHPAGPLAAALVGLAGPGGGLSGIEGVLDRALRGTAGKLVEEHDLYGRVIPGGEHEEVAAQDGTSVRLTIDRDLQWAAEQALAAQVQASAARGGQVVVLDRLTGDVLALASAPSFDPTTWQQHPDQALLRVPAVQDSYEPGSVNKVITMAAALEAHVVTPSTPFTVPNRYAVPGRGRPVQDAEEHGTEQLNATGVLAESSNIGTVQIAQRLGPQRLYDTLRAFGMGSPTGTGLPGESGGLLPPVATWNVAQATTIPFGQGMSATALQVASAYATVANGGVRVQPRVVAGTVTPDGRYHPAPASPTRRVVSPATTQALTAMMEQVTSQGTAEKAQIPGYRVAGKTGTAQAVKDGVYEPGGYVASFAGFAPADAPRFVVEVVIDHPTRGSHFGGDVAAPVFRQVMGFALREFAVPPTGAPTPRLPLCWGGAQPGSGACPGQ